MGRLDEKVSLKGLEEEAVEKIDEEKWVKVQIYTPTHLCTGYIYCSRRRRLLDVLNGIPKSVPGDSDEFLHVSEAEISSPYGKEAMVQAANINKANIIFIKEIGEEHRGLGSQVGHKPYPYVEPFTKTVKLYMPLYTMTGQLHCTEKRRVMDVLNSEQRFIALTNAEICPLAGSIESGVSFIAVDKRQILSLAELGVK